MRRVSSKRYAVRPSVHAVTIPALIGLTVFAAQTLLPSEPLASPIETWQQPITVGEVEPAAVSLTQWTFDFQPAERLLRQLETHDSGGIPLNQATVDLLRDAARQLPDNLDDAAIQRAGFLSRQGYAPEAGAIVERLFTSMIRYRQAIQHDTPESEAANATEALAQLEATNLRQQQYFGNDAHALFGQQLAIREYLLRRRQILEDSSLTPAEQKQRLQQLARPGISKPEAIP